MAQSWFVLGYTYTTLTPQDVDGPSVFDQSQIVTPYVEDAAAGQTLAGQGGSDSFSSVSGVGSATFAAVGASIGLSTVTGASSAFAVATGAVVAVAAASGQSAATATAVGSAVSMGTAVADGSATVASVGANAGISESLGTSFVDEPALETVIAAVGTASGTSDALGVGATGSAGQPAQADVGGGEVRKGIRFRGVERTKLRPEQPPTIPVAPIQSKSLQPTPIDSNRLQSKPIGQTKAERVARALEEAAQARQREAAIRASQIAMKALADAVADRNMADELTAEMIVAEEEQIAVLVTALALAA